MTNLITGATGLNNNLYNLYVQDIISLASTIVIKLDQIGQAMNYLVMQKAGTASLDLDDRTTWKYYQNISGAYNFTDTPMFVESLDGNGQISFDKATLAANPITKAAYVYGSYYYNELVAAYPDQRMLILGIIYPCDIDEAIAAEDGKILSYPSYLVEPTETDFIANLQVYIDGHLGRWVVPTFSQSDNLYVATYFAQLVLALIPAISNIRLRACKTNQAHSFHIGQYLRSHGFLDFYLAEMTREQTLNFYRNINYYLRRVGFADNFEKLVDLLMTKRGLPLYEYEFHHRAQSINYVDVTDTSSLLPAATFKRRPLNNPAKAVPLADYNLTDVFGMTAYDSPGNLLWQQAHQADVEEQLDRSSNARLRTKVIESMLPPSSQARVQAPQKVIFNQWLALAADGTYTASFQFTPPGSSVPIELTQPQAVALWIYAMNKALEPADPPASFVPIEEVPQVVGVEVALHELPSLAYLTSKTSSKVVTQDQLSQALAIGVAAPASITTIDAFSQFCTDVYESMELQNLLYSFQQYPAARAEMQFATSSCYGTIVGKLPGCYVSASPYVGKNYSVFLTEVGFTPSNYSGLDYFNLAIALYQAATGANLNSVNNPVNIQAAMIALLKLLSSYSIQIVSNTNQDDVIDAGRPDVRVSNVNLKETEVGFVSGAEVVCTWEAITEQETVLLDWDALYPLKNPVMNETESATIALDANLAETVYLKPNSVTYVETGIFVSTDEDPVAQFNALTAEQRHAIFAFGA